MSKPTDTKPLLPRRLRRSDALLAAQFTVYREADAWDAAMAAIVTTMGSLADYSASEAAVATLREGSDAHSLAAWWAAAVYPDRVNDLVLMPPSTIGDHTVFGAEGLSLLGDASYAGIISDDDARHWRDELLSGRHDVRLLLSADFLAGAIRQIVAQQTQVISLNEAIGRIRLLNTTFREGADVPEPSTDLLIVTAALSDAIRFLVQALLDSLEGQAAALPSKGEPGHLPVDDLASQVTIADLPRELQEKASGHLFLAATKSATRLDQGLD